jgi:hypothetical protein
LAVSRSGFSIKRAGAISLISLFLIAAGSCVESSAKELNPAPHCPEAKVKDPTQWVHGSVLIKAPPAEVWRSIHEERAKDPDLSYSRVIEQISPTELKLEQKFNFIPVIGSSVCLMSQKEIENERIDYALLHSDRFKAMEGSWVLTSCDEGRKTKLELSSHLDLGLPVPRAFMNGISTKKIQRRLENVRRMAEWNFQKVAARAGHPAE